MTGMVISPGSTNRCGVEQWQLVGLITRRSQVQVLPPLLRDNQRPPGYPKQACPAVFDSESLHKKEIFNEPATYRLECHQRSQLSRMIYFVFLGLRGFGLGALGQRRRVYLWARPISMGAIHSSSSSLEINESAVT